MLLDQSLAVDLERLHALGDGELGIGRSERSDTRWLVSVAPSDGPVAYYTYDRGSGETTFLFHHREELTKYELAPMEPFVFAARDGLEVHGYVTFPLGLPRTNLPAVLDVHGGPWARDQWGYNPEAQWFANRGYLCIQVNFRGSVGYGKAFTNAGDKAWGADDARRPRRRRGARRRAGLGRSRASRHLRRLVRRLRRPGRGHVHTGAVPVRRRHRRTEQPDHLDRDDPGVLAAPDRVVPPAGRQSRDGARLPVVEIAALAGGRPQDPGPGRTGSQRSQGEAVRGGADRGRTQGEGTPVRVPPVRGRGTRLRQAIEP